ncbi:helix-turn-helix protein [Leucobacter luti]|uniref:helix-turn-helix transcriptional regulator n=1 Tax=Leucobacter luti TaxID=340320 RepID=UPI00104AD5E4|nr:helix-turn-helix transcriptional regulator [Leucobacter luti]MCW2287785.1 transcriptional regulator with XRE-family HTH domain [Leucobacter luti]TCK46052.1 helix-turn-helix protein [Leucobacter luti]
MIRPRTPRGIQLGEFLTARRRANSRAAHGLPPGSRRSTVGLSREEVATLAGISVSWYTWLEQGRDINASRQVLTAVARVLQLTDSEAEFVFALAGPGKEVAATLPDQASAQLLRMIDALDFPAFILASDWTIVGWNAGYEWLYGSIAVTPQHERNLLHLVYTDPRLREILPNWERDSRNFLAEFRAESGVRLSSERHRAVVAALSERSADFRAQWAEHTIDRFRSRRRIFVHPDAGELVFEHHRLVPSDAAELHVVMYVPLAPGGSTPFAWGTQRLDSDEMSEAAASVEE